MTQALIRDLILECERAMRQRDEFLKTGVSTAGHGGSHDTCFGAVLARHFPADNVPEAIPPTECKTCHEGPWRHVKGNVYECAACDRIRTNENDEVLDLPLPTDLDALRARVRAAHHDLDTALTALARAETQPRTLDEQIVAAQAEYNSWSPEKKASMRLQGGEHHEL